MNRFNSNLKLFANIKKNWKIPEKCWKPKNHF